MRKLLSLPLKNNTAIFIGYENEHKAKIIEWTTAEDLQSNGFDASRLKGIEELHTLVDKSNIKYFIDSFVKIKYGEPHFYLNYLVTRLLSPLNNVKYAMFAAELICGIVKKIYPDDDSVPKTIANCKRYMGKPSKTNLLRVALSWADSYKAGFEYLFPNLSEEKLESVYYAAHTASCAAQAIYKYANCKLFTSQHEARSNIYHNCKNDYNTVGKLRSAFDELILQRLGLHDPSDICDHSCDIHNCSSRAASLSAWTICLLCSSIESDQELIREGVLSVIINYALDLFENE